MLNLKYYHSLMALFFVMLVCPSFSFENVLVNKYWVHQKYNETNQSYCYRTDTKFRDVSCYLFLPDGNAKIRQNVSWCGTMAPDAKMEFETVEGKWSLTQDSILVIEHIQFGVNDTLRLKIIELTANQLIVKYAY